MGRGGRQPGWEKAALVGRSSVLSRPGKGGPDELEAISARYRRTVETSQSVSAQRPQATVVGTSPYRGHPHFLFAPIGVRGWGAPERRDDRQGMPSEETSRR